jgi:two-component system cell cycle response regulator DivK
MKTNILIIEDNDMNREILVRRLEKRGFEITQALDGKEGVDKATKELPHLILMDINLPVIDGIEATKILKNQKETSHIPIIALTAHVQHKDHKAMLTSGCDDFATKPVDFEALLLKIGKLIGPSL